MERIAEWMRRHLTPDPKFDPANAATDVYPPVPESIRRREAGPPVPAELRQRVERRREMAAMFRDPTFVELLRNALDPDSDWNPTHDENLLDPLNQLRWGLEHGTQPMSPDNPYSPQVPRMPDYPEDDENVPIIQRIRRALEREERR